MRNPFKYMAIQFSISPEDIGPLMRNLATFAGLFLIAQQTLAAQQLPDTVFALRGCESRFPVVGPMRADGIVAGILGVDGRMDTSSTRVLQVESASVAAYRSAAARWLSTCRYLIPRNRPNPPLAVVIALAFDGSAAHVGPAEWVPQLEAGLESAPALVPTQDLPLAPEDRRIEESALPAAGCNVYRDFGATRVFGSVAEARRELNTQLAERSGRVRVEFEVGRDGRVVEASVKVLEGTNAKAAEHFVKAIRQCRYAPARVGGVPVPVRMTLGMSTGTVR